MDGMESFIVIERSKAGGGQELMFAISSLGYYEPAEPLTSCCSLPCIQIPRMFMYNISQLKEDGENRENRENRVRMVNGEASTAFEIWLKF